MLGGSSVDTGTKAKIETDCSVEGFDIVAATGFADGTSIDLLKAGRIDVDTYKPLKLSIGKWRRDTLQRRASKMTICAVTL
ncbi:MAG TPA: hypothetical protein VL202_12140 [Pararhizobium sp.]|uniref:hypothetical protein n=1 Tax=Pararhizobium sp. TaxID=1977563 RepID=UPI002BAFFF22|nr:hypothetical protein [Pararhizobium sp.]HTO31913.1 hypothetical protein [Pararhizobium sp.]